MSHHHYTTSLTRAYCAVQMLSQKGITLFKRTRSGWIWVAWHVGALVGPL